MSQQQGLLAPGREQQLADVQARLQTTGRGGLGLGATTGTGGNISNANVISANTFTASANITAGNLMGPHANGNSNVNIPSANGNINFTAVGNTTMVITGTGANISGTLNATGAVTLGSTLAVTGAATLSSTLAVTSTATAASFIPTSSTAPTNGMYLSTTNTLARRTIWRQRMRCVDF